jgi:hypothetical protein
MLGFDTLYRNDYPDDELAYTSHVETRILLTRDIGLLKRSMVVYGRFMRETAPKRRVMEVMQRFNLGDWVVPFQRCLTCNGQLHQVEKQQVMQQLSASTIQFYDEFHRCEDCGKVYWKGSHYERMREFMSQVLSTSP